MTLTPKPVCCRPAAYDLFKSQVEWIETPNCLINGALAIAMHDLPHVDPAHVHATIEGLAERVKSRVRSTRPQALLAHAHEVLFEEEGFIGNTVDYFNPQNSYLPSVLETRTGIPILLCLVYKAVVERLGIRVYGLNAPGHFLAAVDVENENETMIVDPFFAGRIMSVAETIDRAQEILGKPIRDPESILTTATNRQWLLRILRNLHRIFTNVHRIDDATAMEEMRDILIEEKA